MFEMKRAVTEVTEIMKFQVEEKGLDLELIIGHRVPDMIEGDMKRIKQVFFNLLGNAVKFTFSGKISIHVDFNPSTRQLIAKVKDTGIGI